MYFKYLNVRKLPTLKEIKHSVSVLSTDRRKFIKTMGIGALACNPIVDSLETIKGRNIRFKTKKNELQVFCNRQLCWEISSRIFNDNFNVNYKYKNGKHYISANRLQLKNTQLVFSLKVIVDEYQGWESIFSIPELSFNEKCDFANWLQGAEKIRQTVALDCCIAKIGQNNEFCANGNFTFSVDNAWNLDFCGNGNARLSNENHFYTVNHFSLNPFCGKPYSFIETIEGAGAILKIYNFPEWEKFIENLNINTGTLKTTGKETPVFNIVLYKNVALNFINSNQLAFLPENTSQQNIHFQHFYYFAEYLNEGNQTYIAANIANENNWLYTALGSFKLEADVDLPDFEAYGDAECFSEVYFEPRLRAFKPRIDNAIVLSSIEQDPPKVRITASPNKTIQKKTTKRKKNQSLSKKITDKRITTTKAVKRVVQDKSSKKAQKIQPIINLDISQPKYNPKRAITIRVLRAEDMVLLEFVFHNFKFTNKGQSPYLELDNSKKAGTVIVNFHTQHTLEEAYYESTPIPDSEPSRSQSSGVKLPAKHIRAGKSRLVYRLPSGHEGFPLIMEELLDWSKYKLVVHPRAWIKLPSIQTVKPTRVITDKKAVREPNLNIKYLDTETTEYGLKLAQKTKSKTGKLQVYEEGQISKVLSTETSGTVRSGFQISTVKGINSIMMTVGAVSELHTSIEAPALLYISPNQTNDFNHKTSIQFRKVNEQVVSKLIFDTNLRVFDPLSTGKGEVTELWHTRLGVKLSNGKTSVSTLQHLKTIRALWADDANTEYIQVPERNVPFMASLDANNRHKLVHTTSNYSLGFDPFPVPVSNLMLTTLGAYLDWHAFFDVPTPEDNELDIIEWEHIATLGRDHFVKIVEEGYLFPFGHRAAVVKITERKLDGKTKSAANRQRMYVVVLEKEVIYSRNDPDGNFIEFPFQAIRIETNATPNIDNPGNPPSIIISSENTSYNFYINVGGKGFPFEIIATDKEGKELLFHMPLAFVANRIARDKSLIEEVIDKYRGQESDSYNSANNEADFNGQEIAYAESLVEGDTDFETKIIKFDAQIYPVNGEGELKFHPKIKEAKVYVKQIVEMTGIREAATITLEDDNNKGEIFAKVISDNVVDFSGGSDKSGGFLLPNMSVSGLSKLQGPVSGTLDNMKDLLFDPDDFFQEMTDLPVAKIFGVIDIFSLLLGSSTNPFNLGGSFDDMIDAVKNIREEIDSFKNEILYLENLAEETQQAVGNQIAGLKQQITDKVEELLAALNDSVPRIPNLKTYVTEEAFYAEYKWQPELAEKTIVVFPNLLNVNVDNPSNALTVTTKFEKPFATDKSASMNGSARFEKFGIDIPKLLAVNFNYLEFKSSSSQKTDVKVDIDANNPIEFKGVLSFVNNLQSIIPSGGFSDDGPYVDISTSGVTAGFSISIPNVEVGVCMISNISLGACVTLPFTGAPLTLGFNFCRRENPFMLTISCFGGGGYFLMVTTLKGLQSIEAAFEFGAAISLNVGVASGGVSAMGGFYYKMELKETGEEETTLSGYLRLNGHLSILGLVTLSLEFYLALEAVLVDGKVQKLEGVATLKVKVEIAFFSKTVSVEVSREFKGADADPKFIEMIDQYDWQEYCLAFAG